MIGPSPHTWGTYIKIQVHPHLRGEHSMSIQVHGSSPRLWGTCQITRTSCRFIPTCLGNIDRRLQGRFIPTPVGNMPQSILCIENHVGSSPRLWGTSFLQCRVHPHLRGEHSCNVAGSSPRLWGTFSADKKRRSEIAGSSPRLWGTYFARLPCSLYSPVHPHACGEHAIHP